MYQRFRHYEINVKNIFGAHFQVHRLIMDMDARFGKHRN